MCAWCVSRSSSAVVSFSLPNTCTPFTKCQIRRHNRRRALIPVRQQVELQFVSDQRSSPSGQHDPAPRRKVCGRMVSRNSIDVMNFDMLSRPIANAAGMAVIDK
jgi:hypothetical protein